MRIDNPQFEEINHAESKEPRFVVEIAFDSANTDVVYLTSDVITDLSGVNVINECLESVSGTTQKLNPSKALSTIGSITVKAVDEGLTDLQKTKLDSGFGLKGKRVRFYVGDASLEWDAFILAQTQIIESVEYKNGVYTFKCSDVQRQMRKEIFDAKKTALAQSLSSTDNTVYVYTTAGFETVKHPDSPSGLTDAPGQKVGYIKVENGNDFEIIRYTGKTANYFTGCTRGVLGTRPIVIEKTSDSNADNAPKVTEYIYLEMPAVKLAYALLTGSIYGSPGEYLPDHWNLGISTDYVKTSDFVFIGNDWWDVSNDDKGIAAVVKTTKKTDGKKYIEEQLLRMLGAFSPIFSTGEIGLKRMTIIPSQGSFVRELNTDNVVSFGSLKHDMKAVINRIALQWNYVERKEAFTRNNILIDPYSIAAHGESDVLELKLTTLEGSRNSYATIKNRFDSLRDRYAGPPLLLTLTLTPDQNDIEVGDIVRVNLECLKDYTGSTVSGSLDRNFEIQQVSTNWITGEVKASLFGSSQKASELTAEQPGTPVDVGYWGSEGTEINAENFPGAVSRSGGITTVAANIDLTGHDNVNNASAIYYCNEDLTINDGVVVKTTKSTQFRVAGFFQINGGVSAKESGKTGAIGADCVPYWSFDRYNTRKSLYEPAVGFIGSSASQPGYFISFGPSYATIQSNKPATFYSALSLNASIPLLDLSISGNKVTGLPNDITGVPGAGGGGVDALTYYPISEFGWTITENDIQWPMSMGRTGTRKHLADGGDGGVGGGGIVIICNGADFGVNGYIDTSGGDSKIPSGVNINGKTVYPGRGGGGAPGAVYWLMMSTTANPPSLDSENSRAYYGSSDASGYSTMYTDGGSKKSLPFSSTSGAKTGKAPLPSHVTNYFDSFHRIQFVTGYIAPVEDVPETALEAAAFTLTEHTNTPKSSAATLSTIEVSVTAPSDTNYRYSKVEYRVLNKLGWTDAGPASPEALIIVPSDGSIYEVRCRSVSAGGALSPYGEIKQVSVVDAITAPTDSTLDSVAPLVAVTNLKLQDYVGSVFSGRDAKFSWNNDNGTLEHFLHYQLEIVDTGANTVRLETVTDPFFVYSYEKNKEDYKNQSGSEGANRQFTIKVTPVSRIENNLGDLHEGATASFTVSNAAPGLPTALSIVAGYKLFSLFGVNPSDLDYLGIKVYASKVSGFIPSVFNQVAQNSGFPISINQLNDGTAIDFGTDYYAILVPYDEFGAGSQSSEFHVKTLGSPALTEIPVNETLTVDGRIIANAVDDPYSVILGPHIIGGKAALFAFENSGSAVVAMYEDGTAEFTGNVVITGGQAKTDIANTVRNGNILTNSDFSRGYDGWGTWDQGSQDAEYGVNLSPQWSLAYSNTIFVKTDDEFTEVADVYSDFIAVMPGAKYGATVLSGAHRCRVEIFIVWYDKDFIVLGNSAAGVNDEEFGGGVYEDGYKRIISSGIASLTAKYCRVILRKWPTVSGAIDSYAFWAKAGLFRLDDNQMEVPEWSPGHNEAATAGATWGVNVADQPSDTELLNSNTTPDDIGYTGDLDANKTTNTNQLTDGAGLGNTADWNNVSNIPHGDITNTDDAARYGFNSTFANWAGALPDGWAQWNTSVGTKQTSIVFSGKNAVRWDTNSNQGGMTKAYVFRGALVADSFISGSFEYYLEAYAGPGLPGILIDLGYDATIARTTANATSVEIGKWITVNWSAKVPPGKRITSLRFYVMASYGGMSGGICDCIVNFDNIRFSVFDANSNNGAQRWSELNYIPSRYTDAATPGLNLTATHLGYYDGANWKAVLDASGNFSVGGTAFGTNGVQQQYNAGNPRSYVGDGAEQYIKYENGRLLLGPKTGFRSVNTYNDTGTVFREFIFHAEPAYDFPNYSIQGGYGKKVFLTSKNNSSCNTYYRYYAWGQMVDETMDFTDHAIHFKTIIRAFNVGSFGNNPSLWVDIGGQCPNWNSPSQKSSCGFEFRNDYKIYVHTYNREAALSWEYDTGLTWGNNTDYKIEIVHTPNDSVVFYLNGALCGEMNAPAKCPRGLVRDDFRYAISGVTGPTIGTELHWSSAKLMFYKP